MNHHVFRSRTLNKYRLFTNTNFGSAEKILLELGFPCGFTKPGILIFLPIKWVTLTIKNELTIILQALILQIIAFILVSIHC